MDFPGAPRQDSAPAAKLAIMLMVVATLYVARELLIPLSLAILLSFALAPLVMLLRRIGLPKSLAVVLSVVTAFLVLFALGWLMTAQVGELVRNLPSYQTTVQKKITALKGPTAATGALAEVSKFLNSVGGELKPADGSATPDLTDRGGVVPVQIQEPPRGPLGTLAALITPMLHSVAVAGIVMIFIIFILMQREDLRNRFIKLVGTRDLQKTTSAIDDAARRLSKLLLTQLVLNSLFGVVIAIGLWLIGVPIPALWGILAAVLRFVPYIGAAISAALPIALSAAVDPGWTMLLWTAALFLVLETLVGQFIEPLAFGKTTGLSPVAVVAAATFWTWLWGPIGLILATPMTVCLVVLGRNVKGLAFLEILLSDRPALSPAEIFYQRALAGDAAEIVGVAEQILRERSLSEYYDQIATAGLRLASYDAARGLLSDENAAQISATVERVVDDLEDYDDTSPIAKGPLGAEAEAAIHETVDRKEAAILAPSAMAPRWREPNAVVSIGVETPLDKAAAVMLAQLVNKHGIEASASGSEALSTQVMFDLAKSRPALICLTSLSGGRDARLRYAVRRLRRRLPDAKLVLLNLNDEASARDETVDWTSTSFQDVLNEIVNRAALPESEAAELPQSVPAAVG